MTRLTGIDFVIGNEILMPREFFLLFVMWFAIKRGSNSKEQEMYFKVDNLIQA